MLGIDGTCPLSGGVILTTFRPTELGTPRHRSAMRKPNKIQGRGGRETKETDAGDPALLWGCFSKCQMSCGMWRSIADEFIGNAQRATGLTMTGHSLQPCTAIPYIIHVTAL